MSNERDVILGAVFPSMKAEYVDKETAMTKVQTAQKSYRPWTRQEVNALKSAWRDGLTEKQIALNLRRTEKAVIGKMYRLQGKGQIGKRQYTIAPRNLQTAEIKRRIRDYAEKHQPVRKTKLVKSIPAGYERVSVIVENMLKRGELLRINPKKRYSPLILASHENINKDPVADTSTAGCENLEPKAALPESFARPAPEPQLFGAGRDIGWLIIAAGMGAAGVWLVMILLAISLIQSWGG